MTASPSSGTAICFSERIEISASWTSAAQRVISSKRANLPSLHRAQDRRGHERARRRPLGEEQRVVPGVLDLLLGGAGRALDDEREVAADGRRQVLGQPALRRAGLADEHQRAIRGERGDGDLHERASPMYFGVIATPPTGLALPMTYVSTARGERRQPGAASVPCLGGEGASSACT